MKMNVSFAAKRLKDKKGLTLIELLVVLFILAAVAGVTIGLIPNFQQRTHGSTSAAAIRANETAILGNLITGGLLGNNFDALINPTTGAVPDYVGNANGFAPLPLTTALAGALNEIGITEVHPAAFDDLDDLLANDGNATFDGHDVTTVINVDDTATLATLTAAAVTRLEEDFNLDTDQFDPVFAFGLGEASSLVGVDQAFKEAPVHTPAEGSAATTYARYAVLVGINGDGEAQYISTACIDDGENFNNISRNLGEFFEAAN